MSRFRETARGFPSTKIVTPHELNSRSHSRSTACSCGPERVPRAQLGLGVPNTNTGERIACNTGYFRGIVGRDPTTKVPLDDRKKVQDISIAPYNLMVRFFADTTGPTVFVGSGAVIGRRHILTAAHVVWDLVTDQPQKMFLGILDFKDDEFAIENIYANNDYRLGIPWNLLNPNPLMIRSFVRSDYALVVTTKDLFPANTNFFKYREASTATWNSKELTHLAFPTNGSNELENKLYPCLDVETRPDLFGWQLFGLCDGTMREQKVTDPALSSSLGFVETIFDVNRGHSGGPVFEKVGNEYRIYGMASAINAFCPNNPGRSYFHALYGTSVAYLNASMSDSDGP